MGLWQCLGGPRLCWGWVTFQWAEVDSQARPGLAISRDFCGQLARLVTREETDLCRVEGGAVDEA